MFAEYLAKYYLAKKGFQPGTVPEAAALAAASDYVLTRMDGMSLQILCIVDCEAHPGKQFVPTRDAVEEIGQACLKYTGKMSGTKMPLHIQVMEVGRPIDEPTRARLKAYKRHSLRGKVIQSAWIVDTAAQAVWSNAPFNGLLTGRRFIEARLREPRVPDAELRPAAAAAVAPAGFPYFTGALLLLLAGIFAAEHIFALAPSTGILAPDLKTLIAFGGLNRSLVLGSGEWYRLFSAALLHGDLVHLLLNGFCLYLAGAALEPLVGRAWFLALFVLGALGGSLLSLALNPATVVSVGASGAIMGLLAAAFACSFRFPAGADRLRIQMTMLQVLIPSLLPLAVSRTGTQVDYAGHLGGALTGALLGLALLRTWPLAQPRPRFAAFAAAVALAGWIAFAASFLPAREQLRSQELDALLIPNAQLPKSREEARKAAAGLLARYPRDPRARLYQANNLIEQGDLVGAERELRAGLAEAPLLKSRFRPALGEQMQALLALVLLERGDAPAARAAAQGVCASANLGAMRDTLAKARLCD